MCLGRICVIPYTAGRGSAWLKFDLCILCKLEDWILTILLLDVAHHDWQIKEGNLLSELSCFVEWL